VEEAGEVGLRGGKAREGGGMGGIGPGGDGLPVGAGWCGMAWEVQRSVHSAQPGTAMTPARKTSVAYLVGERVRVGRGQ
jgi:hypothetical protein